MDDEKGKQERDDIRCETAMRTLLDILWRFDESSEGTRSAYDLIGFLVEDMIREGYCAACVNEALTTTLTASGADTAEHKEDDNAVFH